MLGRVKQVHPLLRLIVHRARATLRQRLKAGVYRINRGQATGILYWRRSMPAGWFRRLEPAYQAERRVERFTHGDLVRAVGVGVVLLVEQVLNIQLNAQFRRDIVVRRGVDAGVAR